MDMGLKDRFAERWERYFPGSALPLAFWYSDALDGAQFAAPRSEAKGFRCFFSQLAPVRAGRPRAFNADNLGCVGAVGNLGFAGARSEADVERIAGYVAGVEKLKKTRELAAGVAASNPPAPATGAYLICKRWDALEPGDEPQVAAFLCGADALSGLHALANYERTDPYGVISPCGSGCDTLVGFAMRELASPQPRAVLGSFDPPVRGCVKGDTLSFSVPWPLFAAMAGNMDDCFLDTHQWRGVRRRMARA